MKQLFKNAKNIITILILILSLNGCENNDNDLPEVVADFTHTIKEASGTVSFINTSTNATSYLWDFGDGTTSTEINPIKSYASGTYTITLKAMNVAGASDTYEDTITILRKGPASLPINFDEVAVIYDFTAFGGTAFDIVQNPAVSGTNNKASKVGKITNIGAAYEGVFINLGTQIDLTANKTITMNFWSNSAVDVLLKLEGGTAASIESTTRHGGTGWETISFDFNSSAKYSKLTLFVDGPGTKAGAFYIDDIMQIQTPLPPCSAETAESMSAASLNVTFKSDQTANIIKDGTSFNWVSNPNNTGINTSCKVGNVTNLGVNPWDNVQMDLTAKLDFTTHSGLKIKVYSLKAGTKVTMKLEEIGAPGNNSGNVAATRTKTGEWEELSFPFPATASGKYNKIVIFFDLETTDTDTYYFDDLTFYGTGGGGGGACAAETAESMSAASLNVTFKSDQTAKIIKDGSSFEYLSNPKSDTGINTSCKVGKVTNSGTNPWDNVQINLDAKLDFTTHSGFKLKVYSLKAGTKVTMKLEEIGAAGNNSGDIPATATRTKTGEWEELTFPVPNSASGKFNKIVIFFDLENIDSDTYYFDDLTFYGTGTGTGTGGGGGTATGDIAVNGGFELGNLDGWAVYKNGGAIDAINTDSKTGTWSAKIVADPVGKNPTLKQERKGAGTIKVGDKVKVTFDYKGSAAGGGIYSLQSFVEAANGVNQTVVFSVTPTAVWQTFTQTYTVNAGDVSGGITMEFTAICGGVAGCSSTLLLDNISVIINP